MANHFGCSLSTGDLIRISGDDAAGGRGGGRGGGIYNKVEKANKQYATKESDESGIG